MSAATIGGHPTAACASLPLSLLLSLLLSNQCRAVFSAADEDGDGHLDVTELTEVLQQLGRPVTQDGVQQIMRCV